MNICQLLFHAVDFFLQLIIPMHFLVEFRRKSTTFEHLNLLPDLSPLFSCLVNHVQLCLAQTTPVSSLVNVIFRLPQIRLQSRNLCQKITLSGAQCVTFALN